MSSAHCSFPPRLITTTATALVMSRFSGFITKCNSYLPIKNFELYVLFWARHTALSTTHASRWSGTLLRTTSFSVPSPPSSTTRSTQPPATLITSFAINSYFAEWKHSQAFADSLFPQILCYNAAVIGAVHTQKHSNSDENEEKEKEINNNNSNNNNIPHITLHMIHLETWTWQGGTGHGSCAQHLTEILTSQTHSTQ